MHVWQFFPFGREKSQQGPQTFGKVSSTGKVLYGWIRDLGFNPCLY